MVTAALNLYFGEQEITKMWDHGDMLSLTKFWDHRDMFSLSHQNVGPQDMLPLSKMWDHRDMLPLYKMWDYRDMLSLTELWDHRDMPSLPPKCGTTGIFSLSPNYGTTEICSLSLSSKCGTTGYAPSHQTVGPLGYDLSLSHQNVGPQDMLPLTKLWDHWDMISLSLSHQNVGPQDMLPLTKLWDHWDMISLSHQNVGPQDMLPLTKLWDHWDMISPPLSLAKCETTGICSLSPKIRLQSMSRKYWVMTILRTNSLRGFEVCSTSPSSVTITVTLWVICNTRSIFKARTVGLKLKVFISLIGCCIKAKYLNLAHNLPIPGEKEAELYLPKKISAK